ncbi:hypothetical protein PEL8287_00298 [Roseovarius litorisediminis]|uniref:BioF2-like acetyltransferase domain-containing protein n=2 Tax=Roseovarius litorisediminis TaxID=1312363 RepID=A0A1Y5R9J9_9RHOB|nr:hypothetical protein PEL8287_00298 [Roseovarius litorisediminis]
MKISLASPHTSPPAPSAMQQHPSYGQAIARLGATVQVATLSQDGAVAAQAQIILRRFGPFSVAWMPRGPVWAPSLPPDDKNNVLKTIMASFGKSVQWLATPETLPETELFRGHGFAALITPQTLSEIDLTLSADQQLARQHVKWRNRLRHAFKSSLDVRNTPFDSCRHKSLLAYEADQRRRRGYHALPPAFTIAWAQNTLHQTRLFIARKNSQIVAYMLILLHWPVATYHIGYTGGEGRRLSAHNLLLWTASKWLRENGYSRLDLGQVDTRNSPGLARFKIGSGAAVRALGPGMLALPRLIYPRQSRHAAA